MHKGDERRDDSLLAPLDSLRRTVASVLKGAALKCQLKGAMVSF